MTKLAGREGPETCLVSVHVASMHISVAVLARHDLGLLAAVKFLNQLVGNRFVALFAF
jgi:hypothetical protein